MAPTMPMAQEQVVVAVDAVEQEEGSLLFHLCFYYGVLVVLVEVVVPLLFQRRVRLVLPNVLALALAPQPLPDDAFAQQKARLSAQLRELQRATSAVKTDTKKKKKKKTRDKSASRSTPDAHVRLSSVKAAGDERPASAVRALKTSTRKRRSASKSADASSSSSSSTTTAHTSSHLQYSTDATDSTTVDSYESSLSAPLQPSQLQQPSRSYFASSSSSASVASSSTTAAQSAEEATQAPTPVAAASTTHAPASKHGSHLKRRSAGDRAQTVALYAASASRHIQREQRRQAHEPSESARKDDDAAHSDRVIPSHLQRPAHRDVAQSSASTTSLSSSHSARLTTTTRTAPVTSGGADRRALFDQDAADEEEETKASEAFVTSSVEPHTHRSIGRFVPSQQQRESLFDDSDEEFLSVIRRPQSPVRLAPRRLGARHGNEQMDVEQTIAAAFGGRPLGAAAAPARPFQPVAAPAPVAPPAYQQQQHLHQVNLYEQQRAQYITGRIDSPATHTSHRTYAHTAFSASTNSRDVPRDRTPRIIRRIAFDEEMMALAATPDARATANAYDDDSAAGEKRKRSVLFSPEDDAPDFSRRRTHR